MSVKDVKGYDPLLTDYFLSITGHNAAMADAIAPRADSDEHGKYRYVKLGDLGRKINDVVADKQRAKQVSFATGSDAYVCTKHGFEAVISDDERKAASNQTQLEQEQVLPLALIMALNREIEVRDVTKGATVPSADCQAKWNALAGTKIQDDIRIAVEAVVVGTGGFFMPNLMGVPFSVAMAFGGAAELEAYMTKVFASIVADGVMPPSWRGMKVLVPTVMENVAPEGRADDVDAVWEDSVFIGYCAANPYAFATTFTWQRGSVKKRDELVDCDVYQLRDWRVPKVTNANAGYRIKKCLTLGD